MPNQPPATNVPPLPDPTAAERKKDHIELAFRSRLDAGELDDRFYYEPLLAAHPTPGSLAPLNFLGKTLRAPLWVSSMTGGTALAGTINRNLAQAAREFGFGMGLGSCRQLLHAAEHRADFDVRPILGPDLPLFANLGVAQVDELLARGEHGRIEALVHDLQADGLIVHVNPLQEALQPEGDRFRRPPLAVIEELLERVRVPLIVKEVGQGMGPASLRALLQLPLAAVEFAAAGGTNFAKLELLRSDPGRQAVFEPLAAVGHTAVEMMDFVRELHAGLGERCRVGQLIVSGGLRDFLDGYYLLRRSPLPAVYGQASGFLRHARGEYGELRTFVEAQVRGLELAYALLHVRA
jgi:isopentenyl-diphosphate delta-isomerase